MKSCQHKGTILPVTGQDRVAAKEGEFAGGKWRGKGVFEFEVSPVIEFLLHYLRYSVLVQDGRSCWLAPQFIHFIVYQLKKK